MLSKLFGSNARVKLLKIFLHNPDKKYFIRQLARELKLQVNSVRRELENMEQFGLLISNFGSSNDEENMGLGEDEKVKASSGQEKKYYKADKNFILFEEIKALVIKAQVLYEKDFVDKIKKLGKVKLLVLTGIFVNKLISPVDILIVGKFDKEKLKKLIKNLETELGKEINYSVMDQTEFIHRRDITDVFLYEILEGKNITVINEIY